MKFKLFEKQFMKIISKIISRIKYVKPNFKDILMLIGLILFAKGLYMIYIPSMFIIIGIFLIFIGWPNGDDQ